MSASAPNTQKKEEPKIELKSIATLPAIAADKPVEQKDKDAAIARLDAITIEAVKLAGQPGYNPYLKLAEFASWKSDLIGKDEVKLRKAYALASQQPCVAGEFAVKYDPAPGAPYDPGMKVVKPVE